MDNVAEFEERGIIEFDISPLSRPVAHAELRLTTGTAALWPFSVYLSAYAGDGQLTPTDFSAGSLVRTFLYLGEPEITIDVTTAVNTLITTHAPYVGFTLRKDLSLGPAFIAFPSRASTLHVHTP